MHSLESNAAADRQGGEGSYFLDLFSPETYEIFAGSGQYVTGFRRTLEGLAGHVRVGDRLVCYMTKLSRLVGLLEVQSGYFIDTTPIFSSEADPYVVRFKTKPLIWLPKEQWVPIKEPMLWRHLTFTKGHSPSGSDWTGKLRNSLTRLEARDGACIEKVLRDQAKAGTTYELDEARYQKLVPQRIRRLDKVVTVAVPDEERPVKPPRESYQIQALLGHIGATMGFNVWIPPRDRAAVLPEWSDGKVIDSLPFDYNESTMRTVEQIDVLWLRKRAIVRAFEVEHTTSVYSGILRMADLIALQPNLEIKLHIVAPLSRRDKVFQQIARPVFTMLEGKPLSEICTFISYASVRELAKVQYLRHMTDSVLDEKAEAPEWNDAG